LDFEFLWRRTIVHIRMPSLDMSVQTIRSRILPIIGTVGTPHDSQSEMSRGDMLRDAGDEKIFSTTSPATGHAAIPGLPIDSVPYE